MKKGTLAALSAYLLWGVMPIYWKMLQSVSPIEILAHRIVWSLVFVLVILSARKHWAWLKDIVQRPGAYKRFLLTSILLAINYGTYLWANNNGHIVESSLGYFINPLINVLLGLLFLGERPRPGQWVAIAIATVGVTYLTFTLGRLPWIALTLAFSFGFYGLLRKTASLGSMEGLTVEMALLSVPSIILITILAGRGAGHFAASNPATTLFLIGAGAATAVPMLLFTYGARLVTMTTLGILQYVAPTMQFLIGVFLYNEPFDRSRLVGFILIWTALAIYWVESFVRYRNTRLAAVHPSRPPAPKGRQA